MVMMSRPCSSQTTGKDAVVQRVGVGNKVLYNRGYVVRAADDMQENKHSGAAAVIHQTVDYDAAGLSPIIRSPGWQLSRQR